MQLAVSQEEIRSLGSGGGRALHRPCHFSSGGKQYKPQQTLLLAPFCHSPALLEQGLQTLVLDISPAGGSLPSISSVRPQGPAMLAGVGGAWPGDQPGLSRLGEAGGEQPGSGKWLRKSLFLGWCYQGPGWRHCHQWEQPSHPEGLWRPGEPLCSIPHLPPPNIVTFASYCAADIISIYVVPTVLGVRSSPGPGSLLLKLSQSSFQGGAFSSAAWYYQQHNAAGEAGGPRLEVLLRLVLPCTPMSLLLQGQRAAPTRPAVIYFPIS